MLLSSAAQLLRNIYSRLKENFMFFFERLGDRTVQKRHSVCWSASQVCSGALALPGPSPQPGTPTPHLVPATYPQPGQGGLYSQQVTRVPCNCILYTHAIMCNTHMHTHSYKISSSAIFCCLPRHKSRALDWKRSHRDLNQHTDRVCRCCK